MNSQFVLETPNLLEAYRNDPGVRAECNEKGLYVNFQESSVNVTMYFTEGIEHSSYYHEFSEIVATLTEQDAIVLFINNGGGFISGAEFIRRILYNTMAQTTSIVTDVAASAATIIALSCDELIMEGFSYFMIHSPSFGEYPKKLHELELSAEFAIKQTKAYVKEIYKDFLTDTEILEVIKGQDVYLTAEEVMERWALVQAKRDEVHEAYEQEYLKGNIDGIKQQLAYLESLVIPEEKPKQRAKPKVTKE